jgi:hypothetical protein
MTRKLWASLAFIAVASVASAEPKGTVPRDDAGKYHAHAERDGLVIGAEQLTADQVHKKFSSNLNRCCIVVEVALYPLKDKSVDVLLDDFALRPAETDIAARPMSPQVVAGRLDKKPEVQSRVSTTQSVGVGYESGTYIDPVTGRPVKYHGVDTEASAGVGVDPSATSSGTTADRNRADVETELSEKGLPEGSASKAVAGYLYFPASIREKKRSPLELTYKLKDQTIVFSLQ